MKSVRLLPRASLVALVALVALSALLFTYGNAAAAFDACRGDPILHLSNGKTMTVSVDIGTDVSNVQAVVYVVHLPKKVTVQSVDWFGDPGLLPLESLTVYSDAAVSSYQSDTVVKTLAKAGVSTSTQVNGKIKTTSGYNDQHLKALVVLP